MAQLTVQDIVETGLAPTFAAASAGGDTFSNRDDERTFLVVKNGGASPMTATIPATGTSFKAPGYGVMTKANNVVTVPAGAERWIGPLPARAYNNTAGLASVNYSAVTSVTVAAVRISQIS